MPDDAIERAKKIGIQVAAECPDGTALSIVMAAASGAQLGAMLAFASQQAPEGWRDALDDCVITIAAVRAQASSDDWAESAEHIHEICGASLRKARAMLDAAPSVTLGEVG